MSVTTHTSFGPYVSHMPTPLTFNTDNESVEKVTLRKLFLRFIVFDLFSLFGLLLQRGYRLQYIIIACLTAYQLLLFAALRLLTTQTPARIDAL